MNVAAVQFIAAEASMDVAKPDTPASIYALTTENQQKPTKTNKNKQKPQRIFQGKLSEVNTSVVESDRRIAEMIRRGEIDGIVVMSADPVKANQAVFAAAVEIKTPIVGTGGTSMALVAAKGANVVATSGTTGTTSRTRAVSFVASLCKHWGIKYKPQLGSASPSQSGSGKSLLKRFNIRSIMIPALPGFIAMAIVLALSHIPGLEKLNDIFEILLKGLPVLVAVLAAKQISELDEVSIVAGLLAGLVIWPAILGGVYHAVILPLVLLEMEKSGVSFLGAVDMVGLVMVAAGINLANVIAPREKSEAAIATPGLLINLGFGTFVESAYPFMFANKIVFGSAIFWAGMGGMMLGFFNVKGVAYVPAFASPFLSSNALQMAIVMIATMAMTCLTTIIANRFKPVVQSESTTTAVN
ncbi:PTS sugar transporter [Salmonella enterica subsp. salamae]|nr:PTS sugar transporter [Salmonella enterica subsp. salamae]EDW4020762.1 PTS sugar transporter [Salmonella enterica subsp. salamae]